MNCETCPYRINASFNWKDIRAWERKSKELSFSLIHEALLHQYEKEKWSVNQLAVFFGVTSSAILFRLHMFGAKMRKKGGYHRPWGRKEKVIEMKNLNIKEGEDPS